MEESLEHQLGEPLPQFSLTSENAGKLADLDSIAADLQFVIAATERLQEREEAGTLQSDPVEVSALWQAAAVAYRRCFSSGRGHALSGRSRLAIPADWVDSLGDPELVAFHGVLLSLADKHVAHRVNDAEQARVLVFLQPAEKPSNDVGVGVMRVKLLLPDDFIRLARPLAEGLLAVLGRNVEAGQASIRESLAAWPIKKLYAAAGVPLPDSPSVAASRSAIETPE